MHTWKKAAIAIGLVAVGFYLGRNMPILMPGGEIQPPMAG